MSDADACPYCGDSTSGFAPSNIEAVRITDARGRTVRRAAHSFCADVAAVDPPYVGYCEECGAKHGVEEKTTSCMCGGDIYPKDALDTVEVSVNGSPVEFPTTLPPKPEKLLEAAGFDPQGYTLYREDVGGQCGEPLVVDAGDAFTAEPAEG